MTRLLTTALLLAACAFLALQPARVHAQNGAVDGVVRTASGGVVASAVVEARVANRTIQFQTTDTLGRFLLRDLPPARYDLRITRLGFADFARTVIVRPGLTAAVDIVLTEQAVAVRGLTIEVERERQRF